MFRDNTENDLLVADLRPAHRTYFWEYMVAARGVLVHRCIFPLVRVSARAIDYLLANRVRLSRHQRRRRDWPNDESFVATLLKNAPDMNCRDLNGFGRTLDDENTLSFWKPLDGDRLRMRDGEVTIYHPVLDGADYRAKVERVEAPQPDRRLTRRIRRRLIREVNKPRAGNKRRGLLTPGQMLQRVVGVLPQPGIGRLVARRGQPDAGLRRLALRCGAAAGAQIQVRGGGPVRSVVCRQCQASRHTAVIKRRAPHIGRMQRQGWIVRQAGLQFRGIRRIRRPGQRPRSPFQPGPIGAGVGDEATQEPGGVGQGRIGAAGQPGGGGVGGCEIV